MQLVFLKNESQEGPGFFEDLVKEKKIDYKIIDLNKGEKPPKNFGFDGVIVLGGPDSANDKTEKILWELEFIKEVIERKIPYLGICLGMQLLVKALGGEVIKSPVKEIGFRGPDENFFEIELTEKGKNSPLFKNMDDRLKVFQLHGETVKLSSETELLAKGKFVTVQAVGYKDFAFGIQSHFEVSEEYFRLLIEIDEDLKTLDKEKLVKDFYTIKKEYLNNGKTLFNNFLTLF